LDELVDRRVVLTWLYWGMFLAHSHPLGSAVALSGLFNYPDYLGTNNLGLTFGRLRPVHVNGVIFGAFSTLFIGECYYLVPRLCGVRVVRGEEWGRSAGVGCGASPILAGLISLPFGYNHGLEAGELPLFAEIPLFIVIAAANSTIHCDHRRKRLEPALYVALWYLIAAFIWTTMKPRSGQRDPGLNTISGHQQRGAFHGLYIHYIVGPVDHAGRLRAHLLFSSRSACAIRSTLISSRWSASGPLPLFYPFVGIHHYLYSPIADWSQTLAIRHLHVAHHSSVDRAGELLRAL